MTDSNEKKINFIQFWDKEQIIPLLTGLKLAPGTAEYLQYNNAVTTSHTEEHNASGLPLYQPSYPSPQRILKCSYCNAIFTSREEQVAHYSQDWHSFNVKRSLEGLEPLSQENFSSASYKDKQREKNSDSETNSNDSEDDEDSSDAEEEVSIRKQPRIYFVNSDNQIVSIYRSVLFNKTVEPSSELEMLHKVSSVRKKLNWAIILIGGGHFAAAIFKGEEVLMHKTFHNYTVRAKRGGGQSAHDNKNATNHPKSAGASLRRYNEQSHIQHIQELLGAWEDPLKSCDLLFYRCPKNHQQCLFSGQNPPFLKSDYRLRTIPFSTKQASFAECKKVHKTLMQVLIHENVPQEQESETCKVRNTSSDQRSSKGSSVKRLTAGEKSSLETRDLIGGGNSPEESANEERLKSGIETLTLRDLDPYGSTVEDSRNEKKKKKRKKLEDRQPSNEKEEILPNERLIENVVYTACRTGDLAMLKAILQLSEEKDLADVSDILSADLIGAVMSLEEPIKIFNLRFGPNEKTLLHVAAEKCHKPFMWWLLENGNDPCVANKLKETPYLATKNKEARNHFRRFMAQYPQKYDYEKAQIPGPLTKAMEDELKKKANVKKHQQKTVKDKKEKEKKQELEKKRREEEEKQKFLQLSDREKRALAAEKRFSAMSQSAPRCFQCAADISSLVPFEYSEFKFCSTACVREHRNKLR